MASAEPLQLCRRMQYAITEAKFEVSFIGLKDLKNGRKFPYLVYG